MVCSIECTADQKRYIESKLSEAMENRFRYHYTILGLPFILLNIPFYQKNHYTCSSYIARLLEEAGVCRWEKHFSLVTPGDFYEYGRKEKIFEGSLHEFIMLTGSCVQRRFYAFPFLQPAYAGAAYVKGFLKRGMTHER